MRQWIIGALRVVAGLGGAAFLSLAVAATVLMFYHFDQGSLVLDHHGPYWRYGKLAIGCWFTSGLWVLLWRLLPPVKPGPQSATTGQPAVERHKFTIGFLTTTAL